MSTLDEVKDLAEAVARRRSLRLWDVEMGGGHGGSHVRVMVDADGGVDLETVAQVSEELSRALDLNDPIPGRYTLEVSSPGIERPLKSPEHFALCVGKKVVMKTRSKVIENSNRIEGLIDAASDEAVEIKIDADLSPVSVPYGEIKSARTVFEWKSP